MKQFSNAQGLEVLFEELTDHTYVSHGPSDDFSLPRLRKIWIREWAIY